MWFPARLAQQTISVSRTRWLEKNLGLEGRGPLRVKMLRTDLGTCGLYYTSIMSYPESDTDHGRCVDSVCVAYNVIDDLSYVQQHRHSLCRCRSDTCLHQIDDCLCKRVSKQKAVKLYFERTYPWFWSRKARTCLRFTDSGSSVREQLDVRVHFLGVEQIHRDQRWCIL